MPSHQHRIKRVKQSAARNRRNVARKSKIKTLTKGLRSAATAGDAAASASKLGAVTSAIAKAAKAGALHTRTAARRISRLAKAASKAASK